jgi:hypothetical protein
VAATSADDPTYGAGERVGALALAEALRTVNDQHADLVHARAWSVTIAGGTSAIVAWLIDRTLQAPSCTGSDCVAPLSIAMLVTYLAALGCAAAVFAPRMFVWHQDAASIATEIGWREHDSPEALLAERLDGGGEPKRGRWYQRLRVKADLDHPRVSNEAQLGAIQALLAVQVALSAMAIVLALYWRFRP